MGQFLVEFSQLADYLEKKNIISWQTKNQVFGKIILWFGPEIVDDLPLNKRHTHKKMTRQDPLSFRANSCQRRANLR